MAMEKKTIAGKKTTAPKGKAKVDTKKPTASKVVAARRIAD
jgi:hypothetical protein